MLLITDIAKGVNLADTESLKASAASIATARNDKGVNVALASLAYAVGADGKARQINVAPSFAEAFAAFTAVHYGPASGRKLTDKSATAYRSCYSAFLEAGFHPGYDAAPVADFVLAKVKGAFTSRGKVVRSILAAFPTTVPTEAQMTALVPATKPDTARGEGEDLQERAGKAFGASGTFVSACITNPALNLKRLDMLAAIDDFVGALPANVSSDDDAPSYADEAAKLRASLTPAKKKK